MSGVDHFDLAFRIVDAYPNDLFSTVYTDAAIEFARLEWVDRADRTLRSLEAHLQSRLSDGSRISMVESIDIAAQQAAAWHEIASVDERYVPTATTVTSGLLKAVRRLQREDDQYVAGILLDLLTVQLENDNLEEDAVRPTIDELYVIDDDAIRAEALVRAAEDIGKRRDSRAMNPVVQQAIAIVPIVEDALLATDLTVRLAVMSRDLQRSMDVVSLSDQAMSRAASGLIVEDDTFDSIQRIIRGVYSIHGSSAASDDLEGLMTAILSNVTPQSMRARGYAYAAVEGDVVSYTEVERQLGQISDEVVRGRYTAEYIRRRSVVDRFFDAPSAASVLLNDISLARAEGQDREAILSDIATAFYLTGRSDEFNRLRGLIAGIDEYNRILIRVAQNLAAVDRDTSALEVLELMSGIPQSGFGSDEVPRLSVAQLYVQLEEFDEGIIVSEELENPLLVEFLVSIPPNFLPNPVAAGSLQRIDRRR